jgi:hypothetical protein
MREEENIHPYIDEEICIKLNTSIIKIYIMQKII